MTLTRNLNGEAEPEIDSWMPHEVCHALESHRKAIDLLSLRLAFHLKVGFHQGLVTVQFWEYWTSPEKVAI